jgi:hypothetical protein
MPTRISIFVRQRGQPIPPAPESAFSAPRRTEWQSFITVRHRAESSRRSMEDPRTTEEDWDPKYSRIRNSVRPDESAERAEFSAGNRAATPIVNISIQSPNISS